MLVRLDEGVLIAVGCGERGEAASQAERAGCQAHRYGKGAAGRDHGRATTDAGLAGYTEGTGCLPTHPALARLGGAARSRGRRFGLFQRSPILR
jgi:hypothetical protein